MNLLAFTYYRHPLLYAIIFSTILHLILILLLLLNTAPVNRVHHTGRRLDVIVGSSITICTSDAGAYNLYYQAPPMMRDLINKYDRKLYETIKIREGSRDFVKGVNRAGKQRTQIRSHFSTGIDFKLRRESYYSMKKIGRIIGFKINRKKPLHENLEQFKHSIETYLLDGYKSPIETASPVKKKAAYNSKSKKLSTEICRLYYHCIASRDVEDSIIAKSLEKLYYELPEELKNSLGCIK